MPTYILLNRRREHKRGRQRPEAPGNFITEVKGAFLYGLVFPPTPQNYVKSIQYKPPYSKAYGYVDDKPGPFPFFIMGPALDPESLIPADLATITGPPAQPAAEVQAPGVSPIVNQTPQLPTPLPTAAQAVQVAPFAPGDATTIAGSATPKQIVSSEFPIKQVSIKALDGNAGSIWVNFRSSVAINDGIELQKGQGRFLNINDLSKIYFIATVPGDRLEVMYFV